MNTYAMAGNSRVFLYTFSKAFYPYTYIVYRGKKIVGVYDDDGQIFIIIIIIVVVLPAPNTLRHNSFRFSSIFILFFFFFYVYYIRIHNSNTNNTNTRLCYMRKIPERKRNIKRLCHIVVTHTLMTAGYRFLTTPNDNSEYLIYVIIRNITICVTCFSNKQ